jgi:cytochrome c biogenesis protein CcdA
MVILCLFAFVAGAATALSPCVLPMSRARSPRGARAGGGAPGRRQLVELPSPGSYLLTLSLQPSTEAYAFTFG